MKLTLWRFPFCMCSGCKDDQTSGDVNDVSTFKLPAVVGPGGAGGACTNSMMQTFYKSTALQIPLMSVKSLSRLYRGLCFAISACVF
jgi:hypothetical protein